MRKLISLLLALMLVFSLAACGTSGESETQTPTEGQTEAQTDNNTEAVTDPAGVSYPVTVTDMAGREVTIESEPKSIVSGYYISSSACIALGLEDKMVGIEAKADKRPIYADAAPQLMELPNVGTAKEFDLETCLSTEPDLVILPMKQKDTAAALEELGVPALLVMPESHEQIIEMFTLIGTATNSMEAAQELIAYYEAELAEVEALVAGVSDAPVVYITGTSSYLTTAPGQMYQSTLITAAGGNAAGADIEGSSWTEISYEQLLAMNPDIIVVPTNSFANGAPDFTVEGLLADAQLSEVTAIKNGAVYQMTIGFEAWDSPAPSGILGVKWMLKTIHPDLYSQEAFAADVQEFYETFYGFSVDANELA
ncbi:MAG: ABC transporter substrate-binding protein [Oscillospiraceae bacterium]|nr:ABC transporter substrate-binding protein [Oscillospiraceae bacterium]